MPASRTLLVLATAIVLASALAACGGDGEGTTVTSGGDDPLDGRTFVSVDLTIAQDATGHQLVPGTEVSIGFADGSLSAQAGCNTLFGEYELVDDVLVAEALGMTEMGCQPELAAQDQWLVDFMASEPSWYLDADTLRLTSGPESLLLQDRETADPDRALVGTAWTLDGLVEGEAVSSVPDGVSSTLTLVDSGDGTLIVQGNAGCNEMTGTASGPSGESSGLLEFGPVATTLKACDQTTTSVETHVLSVLTGEVEYEIVSGHLSLTNGGLGLSYRADG